MRILVVDDELVSRKKMAALLKDHGDCDTAGDGKSAIQALKMAHMKETQYDLLFLDIEMPDMTGIEVLDEIQGLEEKWEIPLDKRLKTIMVTAHSNKETVLECAVAGCVDYVVKPFNKETIDRKIAKFFPSQPNRPA